MTKIWVKFVPKALTQTKGMTLIMDFKRKLKPEKSLKVLHILNTHYFFSFDRS